MSFGLIILLVLLIILFYYIISYYWFKNSTLTTSVSDATIMQTIVSTSLATPTTGGYSANFTYSIWFFINDWSYSYGLEKIIFYRSLSGEILDNSACPSDPVPCVTLGATENDLNVSLSVYSPTEAINEVFNCGVTNVPIQKWVNFLMSVYGTTLDLYMDGKLVRTCVMPGTAVVNTTSNIYVTPYGGFSGYISKFQYFPNATDPQTAWNIYARGFSNTWFNNNYSVEVSLYKGGTEQSSITL
jgi:hypothetical protein